MLEDIALGIDLGGTKTYAVVTTPDHTVLATAKCATDATGGPEGVVRSMLQLGEQALGSLGMTLDDAGCIGIAVPAGVEPATGDCLHAPNLGLRNFSLKELFFNLSGREARFGNDGDMGVLAETVCGAARGHKNVLGFFVGTGLGGGVILNGRLLWGNSGVAGELGHMIVKQGGSRCGCGRRGCIEAYCSKIAFVKKIRKLVYKRGMQTMLPPSKFARDTRNIKSKYLAKAYQDGDAVVRSVVDNGAYMLGVAAASASVVVGPDAIVLGGGVVSVLGKEMFEPFRRSFAEHLFALDPNRVELRLSELGDDAVALGASILARSKGNV